MSPSPGASIEPRDTYSFELLVFYYKCCFIGLSGPLDSKFPEEKACALLFLILSTLPQQTYNRHIRNIS